ncbi:hypothetical protein ACHAW6_002844 [Cyclotella cf. meneghiniana]
MYRHECRLMRQDPIGSTPSIIHSHEGVMQGCIWGMILYRIGLLPLAEDLRHENPSILQPWYANNFAIEGPASKVPGLFQCLCQCGPNVGYFLSPAKSYIVCPQASKPTAKATFDATDLPRQFSRGQYYINGFIGSLTKRNHWLTPLIDKWVLGINHLSTVAHCFPHMAYAGLVSYLSTE